MKKYLKITVFFYIMSEINVSYEFLFEVMRSEKNNHEIQKLPTNFYELVVEYIREKQNLLKKDDDLFSMNEKKQVLMLLENLDKILTEIYNRREKKIIELALLKSKARSSIVNINNMLKYEQLFYDRLLITLDNYRNNILQSTLSARDIDIDLIKEQTKHKNQKSIVTVRFLEDIDRFVDEELREYGPYEKETIATLPIQVAKNFEETGKLEFLDNV